MTAVAYHDVQNKVAQFLADNITLPEFQNWLAPAAWDAGNSTDINTAQLIHALELRIAEYDAGHLPRKNFINELQELAVGALDAQPSSSVIPLDPPQEANAPFEPVECSLYAEVCATASGH